MPKEQIPTVATTSRDLVTVETYDLKAMGWQTIAELVWGMVRVRLGGVQVTISRTTDGAWAVVTMDPVNEPGRIDLAVREISAHSAQARIVAQGTDTRTD